MDLVSAVETERRTEEKVSRWLDALPDRFSRIPGDSRLKVKAAQLEQLERERDREMTNRMHMTQQPQLQFNNTERAPTVKIGVDEYLRLIEPDRQRMFAEMEAEAREEKAQRQRRKREEDKQPELLPESHFERSVNEPQSREHIKMEEKDLAEADLPLIDGPPPPIPPRSMLRPSIATFSETAPGTTQHADLINASSSQYSSVVPNEATASGVGSVVRDLELGTRRENPGLVAELRRGMERRRQRERARDEELEREREQEISKAKVWGLKLWK